MSEITWEAIAKGKKAFEDDKSEQASYILQSCNGDKKMAAFLALAAETGLVAVARDVYESLQTLPKPLREDPLGKIQISACDWIEPGTMMAVWDFAPLRSLDISTILED